MIKIKFLLSIILVSAVAIMVGGSFYGSTPVAEGAPQVGWVDDGTVVRLDTITDLVGIGTTSPAEKLGVLGNLFVGGNILLTGLIDGFDISSSAPSWDAAFNQRNRWDGGSNGLNAASGRTSLGLGSLATLNAVSGGVGSTITDNSIVNDDIATSTFPKITGVGVLDNIVLKDSDGPDCHKVTINTAGALSTLAVDCTTGDPLPPPPPTIFEDFNSYPDGDLAGNNGGTGWFNAWSGNIGWDVQGTTVFEGTKAVAGAGDLTEIIRTFTPAANTGILTVAVRRSDKTTGRFLFGIRSGGPGGVGRAFLIMNTADIVIADAAGGNPQTAVSNYAANTWYVIHISWDATANTIKAREDSNPNWTPNVAMSNSGDINELRIANIDGLSGAAYFDDIKL